MFFQKTLDSGHGFNSPQDPVTAIIGAGATLVGGYLQSESAGAAADAQVRSAEAGIAEERRQFDLTRQDLAPWRDIGRGAIDRLSGLSRGNLDFFEASPGYQFRVAEGEKALDRIQSARGNLLSGRGLKEMERYRQGVASDEFGNFWNRQAGLAGIGQTATNIGATLGAQTAGNIGNYLNTAGMARANQAINQGNIWGGAVNDLASNYLLSNYLNQPTSYTQTSYPGGTVNTSYPGYVPSL